jgi:hypothetical protein
VQRSRRQQQTRNARERWNCPFIVGLRCTQVLGPWRLLK